MIKKKLAILTSLAIIFCFALGTTALAEQNEANQQQKAAQAAEDQKAELMQDMERMQQIGKDLREIQEKAIDSDPELKKEMEDFQKSQEELQKRGQKLQEDIQAAMVKQNPKTEDLLEEYGELQQKMQPFMR